MHSTNNPEGFDWAMVYLTHIIISILCCIIMPWSVQYFLVSFCVANVALGAYHIIDKLQS